MGFSLKIKTKDGAQHIISNLDDCTLGDLKSKIHEVTKIVPPLEIRSGFPPKILSLGDEIPLKSCGISSGETLIVDTKPMSQEEKDAIERAKRLEEDEILARQLAEGGDAGSAANGILLKQVVDADNSCLFTSIGFILSGRVDTTVGEHMRQLIAHNVNNDKDTYNAGILGRDNSEYCAWIMQESSWGGAIEVSILSQHYGIEFDVVDITNAMINRFGEDRHYAMRGFLLYDGIHYDPLYLESLSGDTKKTLFSVEEEEYVYDMAQNLAKEAKSSRQYTDCDKFTLRCIQCDAKLKGQSAATKHAKDTGHTQFGEV